MSFSPPPQTPTQRQRSQKRLRLKEKQVEKEFQDNQVHIAKVKVMDMVDQNSYITPSKLNTQKIRGQFNLCLKEDLKLKLKVSHFANEPLSYHIHKNRKMFGKMLKSPKEDIYSSAKKFLNSFTSSFYTPRISQSSPKTARIDQFRNSCYGQSNRDLLGVYQQPQQPQQSNTTYNAQRNIFQQRRCVPQHKQSLQQRRVSEGIKSIISQIQDEQDDIKLNLRNLALQQKIMNQREEQFLRVSDQFQDLQVINERCLKKAFQYRMETERQEKVEADQIAQLYKSAELDPSKKIEDRLALRRKYARQ